MANAVCNTYRRHLEQANSSCQKVAWRLLGAEGRGRKWGGVFNRDKASVWDGGKVWRGIKVMVAQQCEYT